MPPGGNGYYYFSVYLLACQEEYSYFDIQINERICTTYAEQSDKPANDESTSCTAASYVTEGNVSHSAVFVAQIVLFMCLVS